MSKKKHTKAPSPPDKQRCILNGYIQNFIAVTGLIDDALRLSHKPRRMSAEAEAERNKGGDETTSWWSTSECEEALHALRNRGLPELESWRTPALEEARTANALAPIAAAIVKAHHSVEALYGISLSLKGVWDPRYLEPRDHAMDACNELIWLRPLVVSGLTGRGSSGGGTDEPPVVPVVPDRIRAVINLVNSEAERHPHLAEATDKELFEHLREHAQGFPFEQHQFETFRVYMCKWRLATGTQKYSPRAYRAGRSIVKAM